MRSAGNRPRPQMNGVDMADDNRAAVGRRRICLRPSFPLQAAQYCLWRELIDRRYGPNRSKPGFGDPYEINQTKRGAMAETVVKKQESAIGAILGWGGLAVFTLVFAWYIGAPLLTGEQWKDKKNEAID